MNFTPTDTPRTCTQNWHFLNLITSWMFSDNIQFCSVSRRVWKRLLWQITKRVVTKDIILKNAQHETGISGNQLKRKSGTHSHAASVSLSALAKLRKATISSVVSVLVAKLGSHCTDFHEILHLNNFQKICRENPTRVTVTLHENLCSFMITYRWICLHMINVSGKILEKIKTHIPCSI
jgi:hypothetical protein